MRVVDIIREGLSAKVLASVAGSVVGVVVAYLARKGVALGPEVEQALAVLIVAGLTFAVGYIVPEKTSTDGVA